MRAPRTVPLRVFRSRPGDPEPRYQTFLVPDGPRTTVLDALLTVRRGQDPSLTVRHSCLHGSCGTCGVRVNGREVLACVTRLEGLDTPVVVEPLAGLPVLGDLVVDMEDLYRWLEPAGRPLVRASERSRPGLEELARFEDCLECGLCLSACPVAGDPRFLGPAALAAAERVLEEPRGADPRAMLGWVDDAHGAWRCHAAFECSEVCPAGVDPGGAIMRLRRRLLADRLPRLVGRYHREVRP
jgi:succinate dehydrogenase / fumarate reductase iron-sulfur subunit